MTNCTSDAAAIRRAYEFWRFAFVQKEVAKAAQTFIDFPPMQKGASFNLEQLKEELGKKAAAHSSGIGSPRGRI